MADNPNGFGEQEPKHAPSGPVPDLGFFAAPGQATGGSSVGGSSFGGPPPQPEQSRFGGPPAAPTSPFAPPAASQFGGGQFGGAAPPVATPPPPAPKSSSGWKIAAAAVAAVLLIGGVFGGRFAWQQFVADPVLPETLLGMPRFADPTVETAMRGAQDQMLDELAAGSEAEIGIYTDGQGTAYVLIALRGGEKSGSSGDDIDATEGWAETTHGDVTCQTSPPTAELGGGSMCVRGFWRRGVAVMGFGQTPPDPATVARATDEAWAAQ